MMKMSRRARRMERHHQRHKRGMGLNLVSLMDIFTILVFFLLVNSSGVQQVAGSKSVELPQSVSSTPLEETLVVLVSDSDILVQGRPVMSIDQAQEAEGLLLPPLLAELKHQAQRQGLQPGAGQGDALPLTIMGDRTIPYRLLKRIMATSAEAAFATISLAVMRKGEN
jgi:biopolymer transport protein ExbD